MFERFVKDKKALDDVFKAFAVPDAPGCAVGLYQDGKPLYLRGYGSQRLGQREPIGSQTLFNIASVSKQFTAFCVILLQEQGRLSLEDELRRHLPELPARFDGIRLRHLIHHSSGLPCTASQLWLEMGLGQWKATKQSQLAMLRRQHEFNFQPGHSFSYCNDGYSLLAQVLCRRTRGSLDDFAQEHLFRPLGMTRTRFREEETFYFAGMAAGHGRVKGALAAVPTAGCSPGPTDLYTNIEDWARWEENFKTRRVGGTAVHRFFVRPGRYRVPPPAGWSYAAGLEVARFGNRVMHGHTGGEFGYSSYSYRDPRSGLAVTCFFNRSWEGAVWNSYCGLLGFTGYDKGRRGRAPRGPQVPPLGLYWSKDRPLLAELTAAGPDLRLRSGDENRLLRPAGPGRFEAKEGMVPRSYRLERRPAQPPRLHERWSKGPIRSLEYLGPASAKADLRGLAGIYRHPQLGQTYRLGIKVGSLHIWMHRSPYPKTRLRPLGPDCFMGPEAGWYLRFQRDGSGRVKAFEIFDPVGRMKQARYLRLPSASDARFKEPRGAGPGSVTPSYALPMAPPIP